MSDASSLLASGSAPDATVVQWRPSPMAPQHGDAPCPAMGMGLGMHSVAGRVAQGSLAHGVLPAEAGVEQTLQTNILGPTSIQVLWTGARDARGYRLEWKRATGGLRLPSAFHSPFVLAAGGKSPLPAGPEPPRTVALPSSANTYQLTGLQPGTEYRITLYTLYDGREVATPVTTFQTGE